MRCLSCWGRGSLFIGGWGSGETGRPSWLLARGRGGGRLGRRVGPWRAPTYPGRAVGDCRFVRPSLDQHPGEGRSAWGRVFLGGATVYNSHVFHFTNTCYWCRLVTQVS